MRDSVDIFRSQIFNKIDNKVVITEVLTNGFDTQLIRICQPKWMYTGIPILYGGSTEFTIRKFKTTVIIDGVEQTDLIEITKPSEFTQGVKVGDIFELKKPIFINGTRIVANNEWKLNSEYNVENGVPLVWLHETIKEKFHDSPSSFERETTYRLFLLNDVSALQTNIEKRAGAVRAMYGLFGEIKKVIENNKQLKRAGDIDVVSFSYFGTEDKQGIIKAILDADLGGLDVKLDVLIYPPCTNC